MDMATTEGEPAVVLLSGGLDSTVLLHHVAKELGAAPVYALSFRYGQKHGRELEMAAWQAERLRPAVREHRILDLVFFRDLIGDASALVGGTTRVPELADIPAADLVQPPTYVPNRNMILLALAAAYAEAHDCRRVFYGAQAQDEYGYWDCTPAFVDGLNGVLNLNRKHPVRIEAPFSRSQKAGGVRIGLRLGVDFAHTWSCYRGGERPCSVCPTCVERRNAFAAAGVPDPLMGG